MTSQEVRLSEIIAPSFYDVLWDIEDGLHTHYWLKGGRGSTKSSFISIKIVKGIMEDSEANAVVLRKVKDTLKDSVYEQVCWAIEALGVNDYWDIPESKLVLTYKPTGQQIRFRGADKPKKIKSMKFKRGYCKYLWYEELDEFNGIEEIRMINQSLMRGGAKFLVFYSYNPPKSANSWVNSEVKLTRQDRLVHHSNYLSVPEEWLGLQFIVEAEHLKATKLDNYKHEYLGEVTGTGGEVFTNVECRIITDEEIKTFDIIRQGMDFGYAIDPFCYIKVSYNRKKRTLYIYDEVYKVRLSNREAYTLVSAKNVNNEMVIADSAEPKSINEIRQYGLRIRAVKKFADSVDFGIKFLSDLEKIVIDDIRCPETAREFLAYELDKDSNGNFKAGFPDKDNHSIDAIRYALNDELMQHKEEVKKEVDKDSPEAKHQQMVKDMTGGTVPKEFFNY